MADFVLKRKKEFEFQIEGNKETYKLPPFSKLPIDDVEYFNKLQHVELPEQIEIAKTFLLKYEPDLGKINLGDTEFLQIFGAYAKSQQNEAGES